MSSCISLRSTAVLAAIAVLFISIPYAVHAAATFTATEVTSNAAASSIPAVTTAGGVTEVKATATVTISSLPGTSDRFEVGDCRVYFADAGDDVDETDCTGDATVSRTTATGGAGTPRTASQVAAVIRTLTNMTDDFNNHGALAITGSDAALIFTTSGTEAGSTGIALFLMGDFDVSDSASGTVGVTSSTTVTLTGSLPADAADHSVEVDGLGAVDLGASALTAAEVAAAVRTGITGAAGYGAKDYTVSGSGSDIVFTRKATGASGNAAVTRTDASYGAIAQTVTFAPSSASGAETFTVVIDGTSYSARHPHTLKEAVEDLETAIASGAVTCSENDIIVTCTAAVAGTAFTYSASVDNGGGESRPSNGTRRATERVVAPEPLSLEALLAQLRILIAAAQAQGIAISSEATTMLGSSSEEPESFSEDLTVGDSGSGVSALQEALIKLGFEIAAGTTGYFGAQTQAALAAYQEANGIEPASGYYGPVTHKSLRVTGR